MLVKCPKCDSTKVKEVAESKYLCLSCGYKFTDKDLE